VSEALGARRALCPSARYGLSFGALAWQPDGVADDPQLTARVRSLLADETDVVEKRMFGSIGFLVRGALRVGVGRHADHVMMGRVAAADEDAALATRGIGPAVMRGRPMSGWLFFTDEAVATDEQLARWVRSALAAQV
jgi:hypothetical protein